MGIWFSDGGLRMGWAWYGDEAAVVAVMLFDTPSQPGVCTVAKRSKPRPMTLVEFTRRFAAASATLPSCGGVVGSGAPAAALPRATLDETVL